MHNLIPPPQGRVVCAPFVFVQFADFWLGDQLNTLVQVLKDFEYSLCFYMQGINWYDTNAGEAEHGCVVMVQ